MLELSAREGPIEVPPDRIIGRRDASGTCHADHQPCIDHSACTLLLSAWTLRTTANTALMKWAGREGARSAWDKVLFTWPKTCGAAGADGASQKQLDQSFSLAEFEQSRYIILRRLSVKANL